MTYSNKIILNLQRLSSGGGLQNGMSFMTTLKSLRAPEDFIVVAQKNSHLVQLAEKLGFPVLSASNKIDMDLNCRKYFSKRDICFTFFGPPWLRSKDYLINIVGVAYSNLYYPEVDFWKHLPWRKKLVKNFYDRLRMWQTGMADFWIFETEALLHRARHLAHYPVERTDVVRMCPSRLVQPGFIIADEKKYFESKMTQGSRRFLFLAGGNPNKRIVNIAKILRVLHDTYQPGFPIEVVTTLPPQCDYYKKVESELTKFGMDESWINLGPVSPDLVPSLISCCDCMCLFSVLESFSNNMVEAWNMGVPLIVTNAEWSRSEAGNAVFYTDPGNAKQTADVLWDSLQNEEKRNAIIEQGYQQLKTFPDDIEKCEAYLSCIERAGKLGYIGKERKQIVRWICQKD